MFISDFDILYKGITKLSDILGSYIGNLIKIIKDISVDKKGDYNVLEFVYEYLSKNFTANAGKSGRILYSLRIFGFNVRYSCLSFRKSGKNKTHLISESGFLINVGEIVSKKVFLPFLVTSLK